MISRKHKYYFVRSIQRWQEGIGIGTSYKHTHILSTYVCICVWGSSKYVQRILLFHTLENKLILDCIALSALSVFNTFFHIHLRACQEI